MPLDPSVAGLLQFIAAAGYPDLKDGTPAAARAGFRALMVDFRDPSTLAPVESVTEAVIAERPVRVYRPRGVTATVPTIVYLHGGGFVIGDLDTHEGICRRLAHDVGAVVVGVDYRLAPEHPFPAAVEDAWAALQYVHDHITDYGGDADRLAVGGDSAGGNLSAVCAQLAHASGLPLALQVLVYPAVDMGGAYASRDENADGYFLTLEDMQWFLAQYAGVALAEAHPGNAQLLEQAKDPRLSPLLAASLEGLAPAVLATAEFDPLRDEGNAYGAALAAAGVPVEQQQFAGLIHGFYGLEQLSPAIAAATEWINGRVRAVLG